MKSLLVVAVLSFRGVAWNDRERKLADLILLEANPLGDGRAELDKMLIDVETPARAN